MQSNRDEWLRARADHHRETIEEIEQHIGLMQEAGFSLNERTAESPHELDITQQVIAYERQLIVDLQRIVGFLEGQLQTDLR